LRRQGVEEDLFSAVPPHEEAPPVTLGAHQLDPAGVARREPHAQRDRRDRAGREGGENLDAVGVAGDRGARGDSGGERDHPTDLLPRQPPHLVELVHSHVDEDPASALTEPGGRRAFVPLPARDERELAVFTCRDPGAELDEFRDEAPPVADLEHDARLAGGPNRLRRIRGAPATGLLAEHGESGRHQGADELAVTVGGRGHQCRVDSAALV